MTKAKKPAAKVAATKSSAKPEPNKKTHPKKSYMVDDEDDELDLDDKEANDDIDSLDVDPDDADIVSPKTFDPFEDDEDEDDF
ncbi:MAG: hypothetical protein SGJ00_00645 [bacterium]|nr:hypothetical protein [bacterium]